MKKMLLILLALLILAGCAAPAADEPAQPEAETTVETQVEPIPLGTFTAQALTGGEYDERFFSDADLTVINVWATY